jgi:hypothetical protein
MGKNSCRVRTLASSCLGVYLGNVMLVVVWSALPTVHRALIRSGQASTGRACEILMGFMRPAFNRPGRPLFPDNAVYAQVFYRLDPYRRAKAQYGGDDFLHESLPFAWRWKLTPQSGRSTPALGRIRTSRRFAWGLLH